jgi:proline iminopeptidase
VVVVHGGPGVADMAGDAAYFGQLAGDGYDVWVYDQVGTGRSSRLADPRRYDIAREVADLEAIRGRIGADRMVLIGHSWGGQVAASYLAAHPANVARVVFSSPGALAPALDDGAAAGCGPGCPSASSSGCTGCCRDRGCCSPTRCSRSTQGGPRLRR